MADTNRLLALCEQIATAKVAEARAAKTRKAAEAELCKELAFCKPEGQQTYDLDLGTHFGKVVVKQPVTAKVDAKAWLALKLPKSHAASNIVRTKLELDMKAARALQEENPQAWRDVATAITRTPGKPSVTLAEFRAVGAEESV